MNEIIKSILTYGIKSPKFKEFYAICIRMAMACLYLTRNKLNIFELQYRMGLSIKDLACDCISDLFETHENLFIHINKYFDKKLIMGIEQVNDDEIKAYLAILIKSKVNQQLSELRKSFGEIHFNIKKAVDTELKRKPHLYKQVFYKDNRYIFTCNFNELNFSLPQIDDKIIMTSLFEKHFRKYSIPEIMGAIFEIINSQTEFCKAIMYYKLINLLTDFYKNRMRDRD